MTDNLVFTIAILIIAGCNIATLILFIWSNHRNKLTEKAISIMVDYSHMYKQLSDVLILLPQTIQEDGQLTRQRIGQVKTRLSDEERDDQANKRRERNRNRKPSY